MLVFMGWKFHVNLDSQILFILCIAVPSFFGLVHLIVDLKGVLNTGAVSQMTIWASRVHHVRKEVTFCIWHHLIVLWGAWVHPVMPRWSSLCTATPDFRIITNLALFIVISLILIWLDSVNYFMWPSSTRNKGRFLIITSLVEYAFCKILFLII